MSKGRLVLLVAASALIGWALGYVNAGWVWASRLEEAI